MIAFHEYEDTTSKFVAKAFEQLTYSNIFICRTWMGPLFSHWTSFRLPLVSRCSCYSAANRGAGAPELPSLDRPMADRGGTLRLAQRKAATIRQLLY